MQHHTRQSSRLLLVPVTAALLVFASTAFADGDARFRGISAELPTGAIGISAEGLVAAYDFESYTDSGLLKDFGPFHNHGRVQRTRETDAIFGKARVFTSLEDVVDIPQGDSMNLPGPLTIAAWIKLNTSHLHQHILSCDDIFVLWTTTGNQYRLADTQANGITTNQNTTPIGEWHSVVASLSATQGDVLTKNNIKIYIDGQRLDGILESTWAPGKLREADGCLIGAAVSGGEAHASLHFDGELDELLLFSRALTEKEIQIYGAKP